MNDALGVTTRRRGPVWPVLVLVIIVGAGLVALVYRGDALRRQSLPQLSRQAEVTRQVQQRATPPTGWTMTREIPVGLQQPVALALTDTALYVAGDHAVRIFDRHFRHQRDVVLPAPPTCLAASDTALFVGFRDRLNVYHPAGALLAEWPKLSNQSYFTSLAVWEERIWIADSGRRVVWRFTDTGDLLGAGGLRNPRMRYSGLLAPSPHLDLALRPPDHILVNNPGKLRVEVWNRRAELVGLFGRASVDLDGFCGCCNPIALAVLPDGRIVTAEKGIVRVKTYRPNGSFEGVVAAAPPLSRGGGALDLATDAAGRILLLDPRARAVRVFEERKPPSPGHTTTSKGEHGD